VGISTSVHDPCGFAGQIVACGVYRMMRMLDNFAASPPQSAPRSGGRRRAPTDAAPHGTLIKDDEAAFRKLLRGTPASAPVALQAERWAAAWLQPLTPLFCPMSSLFSGAPLLLSSAALRHTAIKSPDSTCIISCQRVPLVLKSVLSIPTQGLNYRDVWDGVAERP
jgi:hypothetical protein